MSWDKIKGGCFETVEISIIHQPKKLSDEGGLAKRVSSTIPRLNKTLLTMKNCVMSWAFNLENKNVIKLRVQLLEVRTQILVPLFRSGCAWFGVFILGCLTFIINTEAWTDSVIFRRRIDQILGDWYQFFSIIQSNKWFKIRRESRPFSSFWTIPMRAWFDVQRWWHDLLSRPFGDCTWG